MCGCYEGSPEDLPYLCDDHSRAVACTLCSSVPSSGFYTGCMVQDGHAPEWNCDGHGKLTRNLRRTTAVTNGARGGGEA